MTKEKADVGKAALRVLQSKRQLAELIALVIDTAKAKGWMAQLVSKDQKAHNYASVSVERVAPNSYEKVSATFDITCSDVVRISHSRTSFHGWGLDDLTKSINEQLHKISWLAPKEKENKPKELESSALIERLLRRFHRSVRQLKHRYDDRAPLLINDEYDLQDLLNSFLRGLFDDVRVEEYAPSYAGGASRMDFLLKSEQIVIETKKASLSLKDRQIGEQLMIDIQRYSSHPDCKQLYCFVYDPDGCLKNPVGLERDLTRAHNKMDVKVIIWSG